MTRKPIAVAVVCALGASLVAVSHASAGSSDRDVRGSSALSSASPSPTPSPTPSVTASTTPSPSPTVIGEVSTSLEAHPQTLRAGSPLHLSGTIRAGSVCYPPYTITVQRRGVREANYSDVATLIVGADQTWSYATAGRYNVRYRALASSEGCAGPPSRAAEVLVKVRIHVRDIERCRIPQHVRGWVQPTRSRERVALQVRGRRRWRTIAGDVLDNRSDFDLVAPRCGEIYRIVWPVQDARNEQGRLIFKLS